MNDEHVQPVQALTSDRSAGLRTMLAVGAPILGLLAVVAGGALGQAPEPDRTVVSLPTSTARLGTANPTRSPVDGPTLEAHGFPTDALGLPVRSVDETLDLVRSGSMRESVVAVAGWLTIRPTEGDCPIAGPSVDSIALCPRDTILHDSPEPFLAIRGGQATRLRSPGVHMHAVSMPGGQVASLAGRQYRGLGPSLLPVPVVLLGKIGDPRRPECRPSGRHCGEELSLERLLWIEGEWHDRQVVRATPRPDDPELSARILRRRIDEAVPGAGALLSETLLPQGRLASVDPDAARAVEPSGQGPLWYVRILIRLPGPGGTYPRDVGWAVIDDATGTVLAASHGRRTSTGLP